MRSILGFALMLGCAATPPRTFATSKQAHETHCAGASDCEIVPRSCCGHCGQAAPGDVRAVLAATYQRPSRCGAASCGTCHDAPDPRLVATCTRAGECAVLDLSRSPLATCQTDAQCVAVARDCCECGAQTRVAVRASSADAYRDRVCSTDEACPDCLPGAPQPAFCHEGHCVLWPEGRDPTLDLR